MYETLLCQTKIEETVLSKKYMNNIQCNHNMSDSSQKYFICQMYGECYATVFTGNIQHTQAFPEDFFGKVEIVLYS